MRHNKTNQRSFLRTAASLLCGFAMASASVSAQSVLFVKGGPGTLGFFEGGSDEQAASITNNQTFNGNHGWGTFAANLRAAGYTTTEISEGTGGNAGVNFAGMNLAQYDVIVLGSNNAIYSAAQINAVDNYVRAGGGLLTVSDGNFGSDFCDSPRSDQGFLSRYGIIVHQDLGTYSLTRAGGDFVNSTHPILAGVNAFDGEGVSPFSLAPTVPAGVTVTRLVRAKNTIALNNGTAGVNQCRGTSRPNNNSDGTLFTATVGQGRVVAHFDRNTFFNQNGAGTSINRFDNNRLALNIMAWLRAAGSTSTNQFRAGITVSLRGNNNRFVSSENGSQSMTCNRLNAGTFERFVVRAEANGTFSLRGNNNLFVSSESGLIPMNCNRPTVGAAERFTVTNVGPNQITLRSNSVQNPNRFVSSENGVSAITCNRLNPGAWETFTWRIEP